MYSAAMSRSSSSISRRYSWNWSQIVATGMSVMSTWLIRIRCSSRSSGPSKTGSWTRQSSGSRRPTGGAELTGPSTRAAGRSPCRARRAPGRASRARARGRVADPARSSSSRPPGSRSSSSRRRWIGSRKAIICSASSFLSSTQPIVGGAALARDPLAQLRRRQQLVELEEVAALRMPGILAPDARRVGEHLDALAADLVGRVREVDRVAVGLRHLAAVEPRHLRRRREQRLRLGEDLAVEGVEAAGDLARQLEVATPGPRRPARSGRGRG